ncbi:DNA-binding protein EMBP-1 [Brachypodium distachyon]|uniref:DNA-binding protein EMBP-1 n=1 Tax=Brachypodium distachyon TaxID=15368 RepID=UPI000D0D1618|nr:DNA-binding protein EMBP-1 [Brachypodium distachyon]|eukprot:XP_024312498.1 DNA-binding protein EMBP-1 [Brachypodium distachyon]
MAASSSSVTSGDNGPPNGGNGTPPPPIHGDWASSMQAYYVAVSVAGHHPYAAWPPPPQHGLMAPGPAYGVPVPFPMYHHPAYYAHAPMAAGAPYMVGEAASAVTVEGNNRKRKTTRVPSGDDASDDDGSQGSSAKTAPGADPDQKFVQGSSSAKRRKSPGAANTEGEPSQAATTMMHNAVTEAPFMGKGRSASKLSVLAPGRVARTNAIPNLNIGMGHSNTSSSTMMPSGQGEVNVGASSQSNGSLSRMDERELKRERRKQANRDSARRSRLRKQQECEELAQKVTELTAINGVLKSEIDQLKKDCEDMEAENTQLMDEVLTHDDEMLESEDPSVLTTLSIQVDVLTARRGRNSKLHKSNNDVSKG